MWYLKGSMPPRCGQDWPTKLCQLKLGNWLATQFPYLSLPLGQLPLVIPSSNTTLTAYIPACFQTLDHTQHININGCTHTPHNKQQQTQNRFWCLFLQCMWYLKCILQPSCGQDCPTKLCQLNLGTDWPAPFPNLG